MPSLRKRPHEEVSGDTVDTPKRDTPRKTASEPSMLERIRGMWQFANLYQWIQLFGKAIKMDDDFDIEVSRPYRTHHSVPGTKSHRTIGPRSRVPEALFDKTARHWNVYAQVPLVPPRPHT